jgi:hypothetical protein
MAENQTTVPASTKSAVEIKKRAVRLSQTCKLTWPLIDLHSPLENQYWQSYNCCREIIQEGVTLTSHYCNKRWCFECNAIRAAKMINGYMPVFEAFKKAQFVTLTRPNVTADSLPSEIEDIIKKFRDLTLYLRRYKKINLKGIRKLEVTFNWHESTYHPHFHILVDSPLSAKAILNEWLQRNPESSPAAQHIRPADKGSYLEMFKYATKIAVSDDISDYAKDIIFQAIQDKRIYQPFGIKKYVSEDVSETVRQQYGCLEPETYKVWRFDDKKLDWLSNTAELLTEVIRNFNNTS